MEFADTTLWIQFAMCLAVFDIKKSRDESGREIIPECEHTNALVRQVRCFKEYMHGVANLLVPKKPSCQFSVFYHAAF